MFKTLDDFDPKGLRTLVRVDLNVPMAGGEVTDDTRIQRVLPTITELAAKGARVILLAHFGRPKGKTVPEMSLAPVADALAVRLGAPVVFAKDSSDPALDALVDGQVALVENLRFNPGEESNDAAFAQSLAIAGDVYVNDAFSAAHRAHASTEAIARLLPAYAGRSMQAELENLERALGRPERPVMAIVGGAKVSTKIALLENLVGKVDKLVVGGGMANTFLAAQGVNVQASLNEPDFAQTALDILTAANAAGCEVILPVDAIGAAGFSAEAEHRALPLDELPKGWMILDNGPRSTANVLAALDGCKTLVWNGPVGAFEMAPYASGTMQIAAEVAKQTQAGQLISVGGGGDTVAALAAAGVEEDMTYISTAGGAFLEWMEGKVLPGVAALG